MNCILKSARIDLKKKKKSWTLSGDEKKELRLEVGSGVPAGTSAGVQGQWLVRERPFLAVVIPGAARRWQHGAAARELKESRSLVLELLPQFHLHPFGHVQAI